MRSYLALGDQESEIKDWTQTYPYLKKMMAFLDKSKLPYFQKSGLGGIYLPVAPPLRSLI